MTDQIVRSDSTHGWISSSCPGCQYDWAVSSCRLRPASRVESLVLERLINLPPCNSHEGGWLAMLT